MENQPSKDDIEKVDKMMDVSVPEPPKPEPESDTYYKIEGSPRPDITINDDSDDSETDEPDEDQASRRSKLKQKLGRRSPDADNPKKSRSGIAKVLIVGLVLVAVGLAIYFFGPKLYDQFWSKSNDSSTPTEVKPVKKTVSEPMSAELAKFIKPTTGEVWYDSPKQLSPQGWLKTELLSSYTDLNDYIVDGRKLTAEEQRIRNLPTYLEVGTRADNKIIFVFGTPDMGQNLYLFEQGPDSKVRLIAKPQSTGTYVTDFQTEAQYLKKLNEETTNKVSSIDQATVYDSLSVPDGIPLDKGEKLHLPEYLGLASGIFNRNDTSVDGQKVRELGGSTLYRIEKSFADTKLTNIGYVLVTPLGTKIDLAYTPNTLSLEKYTFNNNRSATYTDNSGKSVIDTLKPIARGCSGLSASVTRTDALKKADLKAVGKTDTGRIVYMPKDSNAALIEKAYDEYKTFYEQMGSSSKVVSKDEFLADHGLVLIENATGEILTYSRGRYSPEFGCAKPVVYLYPTKAQFVDVRVGADVVISDPLYPAAGWQGVWAMPNGSLTYRGQNYDSLFWEGYGAGEYPAVRSGTVVKQADAASTIRSQLRQQGLNLKETDDFMEFWTPRIPNDPYVRLTWFSGQELERLAPLTVTPKPDSVIRVFLDMDGYKQPPKLENQNLTKFERRGFTVVEWGGLSEDRLQ